MSLAQELAEHVSAAFSGLWVQSHEHEDALTEIARLCQQEDWRLAVWDIEQGLKVAGHTGDETTPGGSDPLAAVRSVGALASPGSAALLVLVNFHRFLGSAEIVQAVARQVMLGKQNRTFLIVLSPLVQLPVELEKLFAVIEHELPGREQLAEIARGIATEEGELPEGDELGRMLDGAGGLTRYEAENAFSLSLVRSGRIAPEAVWRLKGQTLRKQGFLHLHRGGGRFGDLGGLSALKDFCLRAMRRQGDPDPLRRPKGVLLLSPPGCGKSSFFKCLGNETERPTVILDVGALYGGLVGQTEGNVRRALATIDAMQPAVVAVDELEKALAGAGGSQGDSGVSARLFGTLLTWLNDRESDVFVVCTCNDISKLPPEFSRAERFDGLFFIDLPTPEERQGIWDICLRTFSLDSSQPKPNDDGFTGAEIRACCRLAALLDVPLVEAARNVVPISRTAAESVERLRRWATGRCLSADRSGIYAGPGKSSGSRRNIPRPSDN